MADRKALREGHAADVSRRREDANSYAESQCTHASHVYYTAVHARLLYRSHSACIKLAVNACISRCMHVSRVYVTVFSMYFTVRAPISQFRSHSACMRMCCDFKCASGATLPETAAFPT